MSRSIKRAISEYTRKYHSIARIEDADIRGCILYAIEVCKPLNQPDVLYFGIESALMAGITIGFRAARKIYKGNKKDLPAKRRKICNFEETFGSDNQPEGHGKYTTRL